MKKNAGSSFPTINDRGMLPARTLYSVSKSPHLWNTVLPSTAEAYLLQASSQKHFPPRSFDVSNEETWMESVRLLLRKQSLYRYYTAILIDQEK